MRIYIGLTTVQYYLKKPIPSRISNILIVDIMTAITPVLLLILDGFGHRLEGDDNAILHANTPTGTH